MARHDGRKPAQLRPVSIIRRFTRFAPGSVLIKCGETHVLCTAMWQEGVPPWRSGRGSGWVTAEYDMLPGATPDRRRRNRQRVDGRTQEIQRLIGRSLRAVVDLDLLGENSILLDCDVLQADGGTRTASVTGAYVALYDAVKHALREKLIARTPLRDRIAAVSVGRVAGRLLVDLDYAEDSTADVDLNVVMTGAGEFVEVQGTGEGHTFSGEELTRMVGLASRSIRQLFRAQKQALATK
ncbi:MAG: ribonuclease PH [bacterium]|nr:ribonuclease PH [bacterium]